MEWVPFSLMYKGIHITYIYIYTLSRGLPNRQACDSPSVASFNSVAGAVDREALSTLPPSPGRGLARP